MYELIWIFIFLSRLWKFFWNFGGIIFVENFLKWCLFLSIKNSINGVVIIIMLILVIVFVNVVILDLKLFVNLFNIDGIFLGKEFN